LKTGDGVWVGANPPSFISPRVGKAGGKLRAWSPDWFPATYPGVETPAYRPSGFFSEL